MNSSRHKTEQYLYSYEHFATKIEEVAELAIQLLK